MKGGDHMKVKFRQGDSLWYYSQLFQLPYQIIKDSNKEAKKPTIGTLINIPGYYIEEYPLVTDESLEAISTEYEIPLDAIYLVNQGNSNTQLMEKILINVPKRISSFSISCKKNYDYDHLLEDIEVLEDYYPFIDVETIGYTVLGCRIPHIKIGNGSKVIHFNGAFHANEWITTAIIMNFINEYLLALTNKQPLRGIELTPLYEHFTLSIVPMVNPDGVNLVHHGPPEMEPYKNYVVELNSYKNDFKDWKANIRGVDLNNQYPAKWEIEKIRKPQAPAPRDFPGYRPLSEPESIAMEELVERYNFDMVIAFHTQGKEIYWDFLGREPKEAESIVNEFEQVSTYKPVKHLDSYAGFKDWFIYKSRKLGFTVELGEGVNPLPLSQFDRIYKESLGIFMASQYMLLN
jgi:g-D-glutamyl-meso-diaminopimelate peptidase